MEHLILTETEFFRLIDNPGTHIELGTAYNDFTTAVISLCTGMTSCHPILALGYAEIELQHHPALKNTGIHHGVYVSKALSFVRKMQKFLATLQVPPLSNQPHTSKGTITTTSPALQWTGSTLDLVELIYGLSEMGCVNNGETPLKELSAAIYEFFGLKTKECYRYYSAIKLRKNTSRTYFLDKMLAKLNEKIRHDEELERMRK